MHWPVSRYAESARVRSVQLQRLLDGDERDEERRLTSSGSDDGDGGVRVSWVDAGLQEMVLT